MHYTTLRKSVTLKKAFSRSRFVNCSSKKKKKKASVVRNGWKAMITADVPSPYQTVTRFCSNLRPSPFLHPSFLLLVLITTLSLGPLPLPPSPPPRPTIRLFASPAPWPQSCALKAALTSTWPLCSKLCALWSPSLRGLSPPPSPPPPSRTSS